MGNEHFGNGNGLVKEKGWFEKVRYWCSEWKRGDSGAELYKFQNDIRGIGQLNEEIKKHEDIALFDKVDPLLLIAASNFQDTFEKLKDRHGANLEWKALFTYEQDNQIRQIHGMNKCLKKHIDNTRYRADMDNQTIKELRIKIARLEEVNDAMKNTFLGYQEKNIVTAQKQRDDYTKQLKIFVDCANAMSATLKVFEAGQKPKKASQKLRSHVCTCESLGAHKENSDCHWNFCKCKDQEEHQANIKLARCEGDMTFTLTRRRLIDRLNRLERGGGEY